MARQLCVGREKGDAFDESLREQDSVKRIFVEGRKRVDGDGVLARDWKLEIPVVEETTPKNPRLGAEVVAPQSRLDRDLPKTGGAEEKFVADLVEVQPGTRGEPFRLSRRPKEELRIEQKLHAPMPNNAAISRSPMRSKSSGTTISPARKPRRFA